MELPTEEQLDKDYDTWEEYLRELKSVMKDYRNGTQLTRRLGESWGKKDYPKSWKHIRVWMSDFDYESQWKYWKSSMEIDIAIVDKVYSFIVRHDVDSPCSIEIPEGYFGRENKEARENLLGKVIHSLEDIYGVECRDGTDHTFDMIESWRNEEHGI